MSYEMLQSAWAKPSETGRAIAGKLVFCKVLKLEEIEKLSEWNTLRQLYYWSWFTTKNLNLIVLSPCLWGVLIWNETNNSS